MDLRCSISKQICPFILLQLIRNTGQKQYLINCFFFNQLERLDKNKILSFFFLLQAIRKAGQKQNFIFLLILEKPEACSVCKT